MTRTVAQALAYLTLRVVVNSIRRAFSNPLRAILTTLVLAFVLCGWGGALIASLAENPARAQPDMLQPQQLMLRSIGLVVIIHWFYVVFTLIPSMFRPAFALVQESDVHYLFTSGGVLAAVRRGAAAPAVDGSGACRAYNCATVLSCAVPAGVQHGALVEHRAGGDGD
jgi:hypothetical protein